MAYEPKYVEPGYTKSPTADKYLDMAIKCEEKGMSLERVDSLLQKAIEAEMAA